MKVGRWFECYSITRQGKIGAPETNWYLRLGRWRFIVRRCMTPEGGW